MKGRNIGSVGALLLVTISLFGQHCVPNTWLNNAAFAQSFTGSYILSPGDVISVNVFDEPDLSLNEIRLTSSGVLSYPLVGEIALESDTVHTLEEKIRQALLGDYLRDPKVTVALVAYRPLFIGGAVRNPGQIQYAEEMTIEKAITLAGGLTELADTAQISVQRTSQTTGGQINFELGSEVWPGDIISVGMFEPKELAIRYVYLHGEVRSPGRYEFFQGTTVEKLIAQAGGFGTRASKRKISISRDTDPPQKIKKAGLDVLLVPGDVVTVGASLF